MVAEPILAKQVQVAARGDSEAVRNEHVFEPPLSTTGDAGENKGLTLEPYPEFTRRMRA